MQLARALEFAEDAGDTAGTVHIGDLPLAGGAGLADARHGVRDALDVVQGEVHIGGLGHSENVQHGVGGTAHGDIQRHGVFKRRLTGDVTRQCAFIILFVVTFGQFNNAFTSIEEQLLAISVGCQQRAVARLRQAQRFGQAVH